MPTWNAITNNSVIYVRVGTGGAVETNANPDAFDNTWVSRSSGTSVILYGIAWNGFLFVAIGEGGIGISSEDGITWSPINTGVVTDLYGITASSNVFLACGDSGVLRVSQDGLSWLGIDTGTTSDLWDITAANGEYIAVGDNDVIITGEVISTLLDIFLSPFVLVDDAVQTAGIFNVSVSDSIEVDGLFNRATFLPTPILAAVTEHVWMEDQGDTDVGGIVESGFDETSADLDVIASETIWLDEVSQPKYQGDFAELFFVSLNDEAAMSSLQTHDLLIGNGMSVDSVAISDRPFISNEALGDSFALSDSLSGAYGKIVLDSLGVDDALEQITLLNNLINDHLAIGDQASVVGTMLITMADSIAIGDISSIGQIINELIADGVTFSVALTLDGDAYLAWVMNTETMGLTNYENFRFNSMCGFGDAYYSTDGDAIYRLGGDTDAGAVINAEFSTGSTDFGSSFIKSMDRAYFGYSADGQMVLKVVTNEKVEDWYLLEHIPDGVGESRVKIGKGLQAHYWRIKIANKAGADFSFDSIRLLPLKLRGRS